MATNTEAMRAALDAAATSLEAIAKLAGRDEYLMYPEDVRGYANSRAMAARVALAQAEQRQDVPAWVWLTDEEIEALIYERIPEINTTYDPPSLNVLRSIVWGGMHALRAKNARSVGEAVRKEREACATLAESFGPSRPLVSSSPSPRVIGRWEGEQAASANIAKEIHARSAALRNQEGEKG